MGPAASHPCPLHFSLPTSPGSSKIDIHPFLKLSRSGYGEMWRQMSETQWRTQWGCGEGSTVPILAKSDKSLSLCRGAWEASRES